MSQQLEGCNLSYKKKQDGQSKLDSYFLNRNWSKISEFTFLAI